jgi:hypothetical protein
MHLALAMFFHFFCVGKHGFYKLQTVSQVFHHSARIPQSTSMATNNVRVTVVL